MSILSAALLADKRPFFSKAHSLKATRLLSTVPPDLAPVSAKTANGS